MSVKVVIISAVVLTAAAVIAFIPLLLPKPAVPPDTFIVGENSYPAEDYLTGCILAQLKNYSSSAEINDSGISAVAAALYSSLIYLDQKGELNRDVFPSVEYMPPDEAEEYYGFSYDSFEKTARAAARYAMSLDISYNGQRVFLPVCRISSGALIAPAGCGLDMPWLKKLSCLTDRSEPRYDGGCQLSADGFSGIFLARFKTAVLSADPSNWITDIKTDPDGNVLSLVVGKINMSGWEFCSIFGIRSVCFELTYFDRLFSFTTKGDGGSIGMSTAAAMQLGARGQSPEEILSTFFDVEVKSRT